MSLLHPTGEFARKVESVRRAREADEAIPAEHIPKRRLRFKLWRFLPILLLVLKCRHCAKTWPCHSLTEHLHTRYGTDIRLAVFRLSSKRLRARAARRNPTAITHLWRPRRVDRRERELGLR